MLYFYYLYLYCTNALYPLYALYTSNFDVTSYGACIDNTGTPQSITSIPLLASIYAIVPPPPTSTFPSSDT